MRLSGFADEAADGIDGQIEATTALGWRCIEARSIDGVNIHDLPEAGFHDVRRKLASAGVRINCFGSTIANWSKSVEERYFFPDEGVSNVASIVGDLLATGYEGDFGIEPHMAVVFHDPNVTSSASARFDNYVEYGRRFERMLADARRRRAA